MTNASIGRRVSRPKNCGDGAPLETVSSPGFEQNYPSLYGFLANVQETDQFQKTGSVTLFWEDGVYKLVLNDRPMKRSCFLSHTRLVELFHMADRGLRGGSIRWRRKGYRATQKPTLNI